MWINKKMADYIKEKIYIDELNVAKMIKKSFWNLKIKSDSGCILLHEIETKNLDWEYIIQEYENKTGFELYENEIYVETYIKTKKLGKKVYVARRMADCLRMRLRKEYPLEKICIILSVSLDEYCDAKIYFCKVRPEEFERYYYSSQEKIDEFENEMIEVLFTK